MRAFKIKPRRNLNEIVSSWIRLQVTEHLFCNLNVILYTVYWHSADKLYETKSAPNDLLKGLSSGPRPLISIKRWGRGDGGGGRGGVLPDLPPRIHLIVSNPPLTQLPVNHASRRASCLRFMRARAQTQSVQSHVQLASASNTIRAVPCSVGQCLKHIPCSPMLFSWPVPQTQSVQSHVQLASASNSIRAIPCWVGQCLKHNPCSPIYSWPVCLKHNPCSPMFSWLVSQTQSVQSHVQLPVPQTQSVQSHVQLARALNTIRAVPCSVASASLAA